MNVVDVSNGLPEALRSIQAFHLLGVGRPEDPAEAGDASAFSWRFAVIEGSDGSATALAFTTMQHLVGFTKAVNSRRPLTLPTQALRVPPRALATGVAVRLAVDIQPADLATLLADGTLVERRIPELDGTGPS